MRRLRDNFTIVISFLMVLLILGLLILINIEKIKTVNITALITALAALAVPLVTLYISVKKEKKLIKKEKESLLNYQLFFRLKQLIYFYCNNKIVENETKNEILRLIWVKKLQAGIKHLTILINELENNCNSDCPCLSVNKLIELNDICINNILLDYRTFYKSSEYTEIERDAIEYTVRKFDKIHQPAVDIVEATLLTIKEDFRFSGCFLDCQLTILNAYLTAYELTKKHFPEAGNEINGTFSNLKFRKRNYIFDKENNLIQII